MALQSFSHLGICVSDLDRSRRFYENVLGFRHLSSAELGPELAALGEGGNQIVTVHLTDPDGTRIECIVGQPDMSAVASALFA